MTACSDAPGWYYYNLTAEMNADTQVIFNTGEGSSERYPGDNEPGIYLNFTGTEGWYLLSDHKFYTSNPGNGSSTSTSSLGQVASYDWSEDGYTCQIHSENGTLYITPYNDYVVKVFTLPSGSTDTERESITVSATPTIKAEVIEDTEHQLTISTGKLLIVVDKATSVIRFANTDGTTILAENKGLDNSSSTRTISFASMGDLAFYGGGYNGQRLDQDGQSLVMCNTQTGNWTSSTNAPHNICIPFYVSTSGYGVLFDDHYHSATMRPSSSGSTYSSNSLNPISYYFVGSDGSMESVLENYTFLTGRQQLPPYWSLGYITSRYGYTSRSEAESVVSKIKDECLMPLDAIVFDIYWQGRSGTTPYMMGRLDWDESAFPSPEEMIANFKSKNVNTILITEPFFTSSCGNYEELNSKGYFSDNSVSNMSWLGSGNVGLLDVTNQDALDWMWQFYKARTDEGVAGWWLDLGEPESHDSESAYQKGTMKQVHNEYSNRWIEMVYNGLAKDFPDRRHILLPRAGTSGMQRFATFPWTGDIQRSWGGLQAQIPALISSGMSGAAYMGSDVGGFIATSNDETLYRRWVEFATFSPVFRTHSQSTVGSLSGIGPEPFLYSSEAQESMRAFLNKRYAFLPYTYTLAYENATKGTPLARPLNFYAADDATLTNVTQQYLWGKDLLVAPIVDNSTSRTVVFPEGKWVDMNNYSNTYSGGTTTSYNAPLGTLPHFARVGSFIPRYTQEAFENTASINDENLTVLYFADLTKEEYAADESYMFDDDKTSPSSIADGKYSLIRFAGAYADGSNWVSFSSEGNGYEGMPATRNITLIAPNYNRTITIGLKRQYNSPYTYTDTKLSVVTSQEAFDAASDNVLYVTADKTLKIKSSWDVASGRMELYFNQSTTDTDNITIATASADVRATYHNGVASIAYDVPVDGRQASLTLYDISGAAVASLGDIDPSRGTHVVTIDNLCSGIYIARLCVDDIIVTRKLRF